MSGQPHMVELIECACFLVAYFLPTVVALLQGKRVYPIFVINLFGGWTVVGWIIAMFLATARR